MIIHVGPEVCKSVRQFFELNGRVEVERPSRCPQRKEECGSTEPMRKNGSYPRQVIYWGMLIVLSILRFRCRKCGKTLSRPYSWLVPYRRFSAEVISAGVEAYATAENSYYDLSAELSEPEFVEKERDIRQTELYCQQRRAGVVGPAITRKKGNRPAHNTIFYWVDFVCQRIEALLHQFEKAETRKQVLAQVHTTPDGKRWVISERTLRTWLARHRKDQLKGLQNRRHETLGVMKSLDEQVLMQAKGLRERMRTRSIQDILVHLKMKGHDVSRISATTLNRHLNRVGATKEKNHTERGAYQHFAKEHINQLWQTDCTDGIWLPDPLGLKMQRRTYRDVDFKTALIRLKGNRYQASQNLAGERRVQVRWPFDDESAVNIWRRGKFIERAELFVAPADIDYSKRPVRKTEEEPKVLDCSKHLRLAMVARLRGERMPADTSKYGFLTERLANSGALSVWRHTPETQSCRTFQR